jgi:hypothetical protein
MRFGPSENGGVPFKARPVPNSKEATGQRSIFTRVTLEDPHVDGQRASETEPGLSLITAPARSYNDPMTPALHDLRFRLRRLLSHC